MKKLWMIDRRLDLYAPSRMAKLCQLGNVEFHCFTEETFNSDIEQLGLPCAMLVCLRDISKIQDRLRFLEQNGVKILNSPDAIERAADKLESNQLVSRAGLLTPRTVLLSSADVPEDLPFQFPLVVKGYPSGQGNHVALAKNERELKEAYTSFKDSTDGILCQELISTSFGRDLRALILGDRVLGIAERQAQAGNFLAHLCRGGSLIGRPELTRAGELALKIASLHGLSFCGVDFLYGGRASELFFCEVNSAPAFFPPFSEVFGIDIGEAVFKYLHHLSAK